MAQNHEETRAMIVEAARDVFSRYGYKKTTLDDIASSLYRVKSSIYYYFKSKEDLFRAVIEYEAERARKIIFEEIGKHNTPEERLRTYFITIHRFLNETTSYYKLVHEEIVDVLSFSEDITEEREKESYNLIMELLQDGVDKGRFEIADIDATVKAIRFAFHGLYNPYVVKYTFSEKQLNALLDILFVGIRKRS